MTAFAPSRTRWTSPRRGRASASAASCLTCSTNAESTLGTTFSPVHSRKLPHVPQKASASLLWNPHLRHTIMVPLPPACV